MTITLVILAVTAGVTWKLDEAIRPEGVIEDSERPGRLEASIKGQPAMDFTLPDVKTGAPVTLSRLRQKGPVVLILGSFSCDKFCGEISGLLRLRDRYREKAEFVFVYLNEAGHPNPALDAFRAKLPTETSPTTAGLELYQFDVPCVIDSDHQLEEYFRAWPVRLLIIGSDGIVKWDSNPGITEKGLRLPEADRVLQQG